MNLSNCNYYVVVYNSRRCFRVPFSTMHGAKRCFKRYSNVGFHCEIHDRISGLVILVI